MSPTELRPEGELTRMRWAVVMLVVGVVVFVGGLLVMVIVSPPF